MRKEKISINRYQQKGVSQKSRKELRKEKKQEKKNRKRQYFQSRAHKDIPTKPINKAINNNRQHALVKKQKGRLENKPNASTTMKSIRKEQLKTNTVKEIKKKVVQTQDDKMIRLCEQKLGIAEGKEKYNKLAKNYGFDDDIFDFLDGISKKVGTDNYQYDQQQSGEQINSQEEQLNSLDENQILQEEQEQEEIGDQDQLLAGDDQWIQNAEEEEDLDNDFDQMFENLEQFEQGNEQIQEQQYEPKQKISKTAKIQTITDNKKKNQKQIQKYQHFPRKGQVTEGKSQQIQIRKSMNSLLNKLSDGNVLLTFREFVKIIQSNSRSLTIPVYAQLFTKFNLMIQKPLFHILATNIALLAALHYTIGNRLLAPVLHTLTHKYLSINNQQQNKAEIAEIGYSKKFQRLKNFATIISLLYNYSSISGQFIQSYVFWLTQSLDKGKIELIYIIIQKCGLQIRQKDPSILKNIINLIKESIQSYKKQCEGSQEQLQKIHFIELQLNEIRFNKKTQTGIDQRMAFLQTFINKNVRKQIQKQKQVFPLNFQNLLKIDISRTNWWQTQFNTQNSDQYIDNDNQNNAELNQIVKQKGKLLELAKSFHMVTQTKKNIFICLMDSKDFLQATQRILELKIKNYQQVATVLVETCTLEPNFNAYYPLVAAKLANLMPKFRLNLQYAIWDHLKLIDQYELRRTSNLAKFTAKLLSDPISNCSLSTLKYYPDLTNVSTIDRTFLDIFFNFFFKKVKKQYLIKLTNKLREDNNRDIKLALREFLADFDCEGIVQEKAQLCRRLLMMELDERKFEMGDD